MKERFINLIKEFKVHKTTIKANRKTSQIGKVINDITLFKK